MDDNQKIIAELDKSNPSWWKNFADLQDLKDLIEERTTPDRIKVRVFNRHIIFINAAICAGVVKV